MPSCTTLGHADGDRDRYPAPCQMVLSDAADALVSLLSPRAEAALGSWAGGAEGQLKVFQFIVLYQTADPSPGMK